MTELLHLTPVYRTVENGWTQAELTELPGVVTAAPSQEEAEELLVDALREFLLSFGPAQASDSTNLTPDNTLILTVNVGRRTPAA